MRLKWGSEQIDNFRMPTAEKENWLTRIIDRWFWWLVLSVCTGAVIWICIKLYQLYTIRVWLESL